MKNFEIDKQGFIHINRIYNPLSERGLVTWNGIRDGNLEEILEAVKKTQQKILNKQIQELQDSKNPPDGKAFDFDLAKADQYQKIVEGVKRMWNYSLEQLAIKRLMLTRDLSDEAKTLLEKDIDTTLFVINSLEDMVDYRTGKDIQDL